MKDSKSNRLAGETSPYLRQHADNPVAWQPWDEAALDRARAEDLPIFLSVGYSACHWCHVMARESFENKEIAAILNSKFVAIKVDREERPDLDEIYMRSVQMMTGRGGWPMSVFLTPDLKPFYGGTYFPPEDRGGMPGFKRVIRQIGEMWSEDRQKLLRSADSLTRQLIDSADSAKGSEKSSRAADSWEGVSDKYASALRASFDEEWGGFGPAPKFPQPEGIRFLLREYARAGGESMRAMAEKTLESMACGGICDQLGGGFHRYATDRRWIVPHFEKMLYDNALLASVYLEAYQLCGRELYRDTAAATMDFVLREMVDERDGFHSALNADSEGGEGRFYLWSVEEVMEQLGSDAGQLFCEYYNLAKDGNFEGLNILNVDPGTQLGAEEAERIAVSKQKLLQVRATRANPSKDDKVLADWNGMMISALALGGRVLGDARYGQAATRAGEFIVDKMMENGELFHSYREGVKRVPGFLEDYANIAQAFLELYETNFELVWLQRSRALTDKMLELFLDNANGGLFSTSPRHSDLLVRTKSFHDAATPAGNAVAAATMLRLHRLTECKLYRDRAEEILQLARPVMSAQSFGYGGMFNVLLFRQSPPLEIAIVGPRATRKTEAMLASIHKRFLPYKVVAFLDPSDRDKERTVAEIPLLRGRAGVDRHTAAYICRNHTCSPPVVDPQDLDDIIEQN